MKIKCHFCNGDGWVIGSEHHYNCDGSCQDSRCPVPVQEQCHHCGGVGYDVEVDIGEIE